MDFETARQNMLTAGTKTASVDISSRFDQFIQLGTWDDHLDLETFWFEDLEFYTYNFKLGSSIQFEEPTYSNH